MPFRVVEEMESRRKLAHDVLVGGSSLSQACREAGVTRKTGRKWVERAREEGIEALSERSRRPLSSPARTDEGRETALLELKDRHPEWGARKLVRLLEFERGIALPTRTAERLLQRRGRTAPPSPPAPPLERFERESCGALLQTDFKGLPKSCPYALLTVLDDHARFCLHFAPVPDKTGASVKAALWGLFGEHGLPESMLMDNGDCWGSVSKAPTAFEAWLMLLGVRPLHGRPGHPQTQGKVERFHGTAKTELGERLARPSMEEARREIGPFVSRYNWLRPHDALGGAVPGSRYRPFPRKRPERLPGHEIPEGAVSRKVDERGFFSFEGREYRAGKGLVGHRVALVEGEFGTRLRFAGFDLPYLHEL